MVGAEARDDWLWPGPGLRRGAAHAGTNRWPDPDCYIWQRRCAGALQRWLGSQALASSRGPQGAGPQRQWHVVAAGLVERLLRAPSNVVKRLLARVFGDRFVGDLEDFFTVIHGIHSEVRHRQEEVQKLLRSKDTAFLLVTSPMSSVVDEALFFLAFMLNDLGEEKEAVDRYSDLVKTHAESGFVPDAYNAIGEYYFNNNNAFFTLT